MIYKLILSALLALLWGSAAWLWHYRDQLDKLNKKLPLIFKYRKPGLHPLFRSRADVLWLAGWFFGIGLLLFGVALARIL